MLQFSCLYLLNLAAEACLFFLLVKFVEGRVFSFLEIHSSNAIIGDYKCSKGRARSATS